MFYHYINKFCLFLCVFTPKYYVSNRSIFLYSFSKMCTHISHSVNIYSLLNAYFAYLLVCFIYCSTSILCVCILFFQIKKYVLVGLSCCNGRPETVCLTKQTSFFFSSSGGFKVPHQGASRFSVRCEPSWFADSPLIFSRGLEKHHLSLASLCKDTSFIIKNSVS